MGVNLGTRCPPSAPFRARSILAKWGNPVALQVHGLAFNRSKNVFFGSVPYWPAPIQRQRDGDGDGGDDDDDEDDTDDIDDDNGRDSDDDNSDSIGCTPPLRVI